MTSVVGVEVSVSVGPPPTRVSGTTPRVASGSRVRETGQCEGVLETQE